MLLDLIILNVSSMHSYKLIWYIAVVKNQSHFNYNNQHYTVGTNTLKMIIELCAVCSLMKQVSS